MREGEYVDDKTPDDATVVVKSPAWTRFALAPVFLLFCGIALFFLADTLVPGQPVAACLAMSVLCGLPARWLWSFIEPRQFSLNLKEQTYTLADGFSPRKRVLHGSTHRDIDHIFVQKSRVNRQDVSFRIVLVWKIKQMSVVLRRSYNDPQGEEEWAQGIADEIDVPFCGTVATVSSLSM